MPLSTILCRMGSKKSLQKVIKNKTPDNYTTYIEPFVGSGAIYYHLDVAPDVRCVINDLDKPVVDMLKFIKSRPNISNLSKYEAMDGDVAKYQSFVNKTHTGKMDKFVKNLIIACTTFGGKGKGKIYKDTSMVRKLVKIPELAEYMRNTTVLNQDYKTVIRKYDNPNAFIFLDPPYEDSERLYKDGTMDFVEMANILKKVKGKFMLTINDSPNIRKIFTGFKKASVTVQSQSNSDIGGDNRKELIITNY